MRCTEGSVVLTVCNSEQGMAMTRVVLSMRGKCYMGPDRPLKLCWHSGGTLLSLSGQNAPYGLPYERKPLTVPN